MSISYSVANFLTGAVTGDLPVRKGAQWSQTLNRHDAVTVEINMRDAANRKLDIDGITTPWKSVIFAEDSISGLTKATCLIVDRHWKDDDRVLALDVIGIVGYFEQKALIGPAAAATAALTLSTGRPNTALDTVITGASLPAIGRRLVAQWLTWQGATMPFVLPPDEAGSATRSYPFLDFRYVGSALADLTATENGPDYAFRSRRTASGTSVEFVMSTGTANRPYIGSYLGIWVQGGAAGQVSKLEVEDDASGMASHAYGTGAATTRAVLWSRSVNTSLVTDQGYPPMVTVDTAHSSVTAQGTLDGYVRENLNYAAGTQRTLSFTVRVDPKLGINFNVGDMVDVDIAEGNYWLKPGLIPIRITSIKGDEVSGDVGIECVIWPRS